MKNFVMFLSEHYVKVSILLGLIVGLIVNLNYTTIHKEDGKYIWECTMGPIYERAEYGDGYVGKWIFNDKEVYTVSIG